MSQNSTSSIIILPSSHQPSSSSRYLSPFSVFLQHIHLSEQLIIQLSSSLHLPLSTLFWLHSIYASLPTESASLSSWNTILNYPSVAGTTDDSSQSDYDNDSIIEYQDKRMKLQSSHSSQLSDSSSSINLSNIASTCYLEIKNPYAAMSLLQSNQLQQQLSILTQSNYNHSISSMFFLLLSAS